MVKRKVNGIEGIALFALYSLTLSLTIGAVWTLGFTLILEEASFLTMFPLGIFIGIIFVSFLVYRWGIFNDTLFSYYEFRDIGNVELKSGELLVCDPFFLKKRPEGVVELKGLNAGSIPVRLTLKHHGKAKIITLAEIGSTEIGGVKRLLGRIPIISNSVCIVDKQSFKSKFKFQGSERVGMIYSKRHKEIAEKIKRKLEIDYMEESETTSRFLESISENLERGIRTFLNQEEKEAFFIWTNNTFDMISKKLGENYQEDFTYTIETLDEDTEENIAVFSAMKDKYLAVYGVFNESKLARIVIESK